MTGAFECSNKYALCKVSYLHKPLRFSDFSILLCSVFECDIASMSITICFVCSNVVSVGVMFSLGVVYLDICCVYVCVCICGMQAYLFG